jgi:hypothetical protein
MGRPTTGFALDANQARPMTAVRGAGYSSAGNRGVLIAVFANVKTMCDYFYV